MAISTINNPAALTIPGSVLQTVFAQNSTYTSITSNAVWTTIGLTASITPKSTANKVLVLAWINGRNFTGGLGVDLQVNKNGSTVYTQYEWSQMGPTSADGVGLLWPIAYLDSPSSTSSLAYTFALRFRGGNAGTFDVNNTSGAGGTVSSTILLQEIAG